MAISDTDQDGRRRLLVYVRPDSLGGCLDDWLPGQCAKGLVRFSCVRPSRAALSIKLVARESLMPALHKLKLAGLSAVQLDSALVCSLRTRCTS